MKDWQPKTDLRGLSIRGAIAGSASQMLSVALKMGYVATIARLLTPADFGLVAMVTSVTGILAVFQDAGLSTDHGSTRESHGGSSECCILV